MTVPTFSREDVLPRRTDVQGYEKDCFDEVALLQDPIRVQDLTATVLNTGMIWRATTRLPDTPDNRHRQRLLGVSLLHEAQYLLEHFCGRCLGSFLQLVQVIASVNDDGERWRRVFRLRENGHARAVATPESAARVIEGTEFRGSVRLTVDEAELILVSLVVLAMDLPAYTEKFVAAWREASVESHRHLLQCAVEEGHASADEAVRDEVLATVGGDGVLSRLGQIEHVVTWVLLPHYRHGRRLEILEMGPDERAATYRASVWMEAQRRRIDHVFGAEEPTFTIRPGWAPRPDWIGV